MLPFVVALVALGCCFPVLASVQAARSIEDTRDDDDSEAAAGLLGGSEAVQKPVVTTLRNTIIYLKNELSHAVTDSNILLVLLGHFICPVRQELVFQILIPYTSKRFTMPISKAGLILSLVASINLLIFILVLPAITRYLRVRRSFSASRIDTLTASTSSLLLAFGCILIGAASTLPLLITTTIVFAAGFGIRLGLLSLLSSLVDPAKIGRVYTLVTVVEGFGEMVSAPVLQGLWAWGLGKGGGWMGAPWWGGAVVYAAGWWFIGRVHVRGERRDG